LNIRKKGAGLAFTATLLASLIAVVAAPLASAAVTVTSAGTVPRAGTSATAAVFTLTENSAACFGVAVPYNVPDGGFISIQILDSASAPTVHFVAPVGLSAPGSLGASATLQNAGGTNNVLTIRLTGHDDLNIEQIIASAKISADAGATNGAIKATLVNIPPAANPGATNQGSCVVSVPATVTASGRLGNSTTASANGTQSGAGTTTTATVAGAPWTVNQFAGYTVTFTAGTAANIGQSRTITSNTVNGLTFPALPAATANGDLFTISTTSYPAGSTTFNIVLDAGSCDFVTTATPLAGNLTFVTNAENHPITTAPASAAGLQNGVVTTPGTTNAHFPGEAVTQTVPNCGTLTFPFAIGSPGTVGNALTQTAGTPTIVNVGENNQPTASTTLSEGPSSTGGTITGAVTFTILTPNVLFSASPTVTYGGPITGPSVCSISVDRKSCTVTVANSGTSATNPGLGSVTITNIRVDVASTATAGAPVVIAGTNGSTPVNTTSATVAFVGRVLVGVSAQPTIYIGFNDQQSGMKTITESGAGFFQSGVGSNNTFGLCIYSGETFTRAPWAVVTVPGGVGPAGLQLLNPATATAVTQIQGTLTNGGTCAYWTVFSGSTAGPATIEIRGSADGVTPLPTGALNGPRLSVPSVGVTPGSEQAAILVGTAAPVIGGCTNVITCNLNPAFAGVVSEAIRAFKNSVTVTAASQPNCPPGTADCLLGNIVITETQNGQFKAGDVIRGYFVPDSKSLRNDVLIKAGNTNDLPIITTNSASGLLVTPVTVICPPAVPLINICFFAFAVTQQSFGPTLGQVTVSNIHATIAKDATPGPINMDWGNTAFILGVPVGTPAGQPFETVVSNGNVGNGPTPPATTKTSAASASGKTQTASAFTVGTKVVSLVAGTNNIVTIRIKVDPALIGKSVVIQRATKNSAGVWSAFTNLTSRTIGADGYAYYYASAHSAQWNSYRGKFLGNAQWAPSQSQAIQVRWK